MSIGTGADVLAILGDIVHEPTQAGERSVDLTVDEVHRVTGPGALDFGGSELEAAPTEPIEPELRDPDDSYGWWELDEGTYLVGYNETVGDPDGLLLLVLPHERLLRAGAHHAAFAVDGERAPLRTLLQVGPAGCRIKENARTSTALLVG